MTEIYGGVIVHGWGRECRRSESSALNKSVLMWSFMRYYKPSGCQDSRIRCGILLTLFLAKVYLAFSFKVFELFDLQMTVASMLLDEECFLVLMLAQLWLGQAFLILLSLTFFEVS